MSEASASLPASISPAFAEPLALLSKGEPESCSFQALIWIENLDDLPSRQLKRKVDRLEALLRGLANTPGLPGAHTIPPPPTACSLPVPASPPPSVPQRPSSAPGSVETAMPPSPTMDERARSEACKALVRAFLSDEYVLDEPLLGIDPVALSAQLRAVGTCHLTAFPAHRIPTPASLHDTLSADDYRQTVQAVLPTRAQAYVALEAYLADGNSVLRLLNPPTFLRQCETFWATGRVPEANWLATYLIACASGLYGLDRSSEAGQDALPTGAPQELLARTWADAGRRVLSANKFLVKPTVEGIRAFSLLLPWWSAEGCRYFEEALTVSASVVASAYELNLHRDPDEVAAHLSPAEKNDRRRIFWTLYVFESMARPVLGKTYLPFDEDAITARYPDEPVEGETPSSPSSPNVIFTAAALNARVSRLMVRRQAVSRDDVLHALDELDSFIGRYEDRPLATAMSRYSYNRLYRFAARIGLSNREQDVAAAKHFRDLLLMVESMRRSPVRGNPLVLLRIVAAAIDAAVDLHATAAFPRSLRHQLANFVNSLRSPFYDPVLARMAARAIVILDHALDRHAQKESAHQQGWSDSASTMSLTPSKTTTPTTGGTYSDCTTFFPTDYSQHFPQLYQQPIFSAPPPAVSYFAYAPPPMHQHQHQPNPHPHFAVPPVPQTIRPTRPALSVYTTVAPPAQGTKLSTPIHSPWIDTATTPTRYAAAYQWTDRALM
ncbi:fungal specific transcription factor [Rhodotorula toruloides]|uniref:Fungal specific transcription factor n=1 Tax=Rhodotorula toruloides TaxID=5286 RepID=A0A511KAH6_RHOTO|nr:fungal specific transcription factor [Rhodotorula toruloides]